VTVTLTGLVHFAHLVHHGSTAVRLAVCAIALTVLWVVLKMAEYAIIPD
jgi:hypothetical protein